MNKTSYEELAAENEKLWAFICTLPRYEDSSDWWDWFRNKMERLQDEII